MTPADLTDFLSNQGGLPPDAAHSVAAAEDEQLLLLVTVSEQITAER